MKILPSLIAAFVIFWTRDAEYTDVLQVSDDAGQTWSNISGPYLLEGDEYRVDWPGEKRSEIFRVLRLTP